MSAPYQDLFEQNLAEINSLLAEKGAPWATESSGKGDITMESKIYKDGLKIFRGSTTVNGSLDDIVDIVWNATEKDAKGVDKYVTSFKSGIKSFKDFPDIRVDYALMTFPWPVWKREMSYAMTKKKFSPSKAIIWAGSVTDVKLPPVKKTVKMADVRILHHRYFVIY